MEGAVREEKRLCGGGGVTGRARRPKCWTDRESAPVSPLGTAACAKRGVCAEQWKRRKRRKRKTIKKRSKWRMKQIRKVIVEWVCVTRASGDSASSSAQPVHSRPAAHPSAARAAGQRGRGGRRLRRAPPPSTSAAGTPESARAPPPPPAPPRSPARPACRKRPARASRGRWRRWCGW